MTLPGNDIRAIVTYTTDENKTFTILQKQSVAQAVHNPIVGIQANQGTPERWILRHIFIGTVYGGTYWRRKIIIANPANPYFTGMFNFLVIDGVQWMIIDRKGENRRGPYLTH